MELGGSVFVEEGKAPQSGGVAVGRPGPEQARALATRPCGHGLRLNPANPHE